jgi:hypothetical protein
LPTDELFILGWVGPNLPSKRDVEDDLETREEGTEEELERRAPEQALLSIQNSAAAAQAATAGNWMIGNNPAPISCKSSTAYSLVNGQLLQGTTSISKYYGDTVVAFGAATNGNVNPVISVGFSLVNGLLAWQSPTLAWPCSTHTEVLCTLSSTRQTPSLFSHLVIAVLWQLAVYHLRHAQPRLTSP